ncbi:MAG: MltA domain-containing protein [Pseudomonadota bacterium]
MGEICRRAFLAGLGAAALPQMSGAVEARPISYSDLDGWETDDHEAALATWKKSCAEAKVGPLCALPTRNAKWFWEAHFTPVLFGDPDQSLFTGYYEPVIPASRKPGGKWKVPVYAPPSDLRRRWPHYTRAEIETGALRGKGLELFWLEDPVDAFFLHIQGSGRLLLTDGTLIRLGFAAKNGHRYVSIGRIFNRMKKKAPLTYGAAPLKAWLRANPRDGAALMRKNPSFIFFQERSGLEMGDGPVGAIGVPLTGGRSIAIDQDRNALGGPYWVETDTAAGPLNRLMIGQDTGSAVNGLQRADIFFGTGDEAGQIAGSTRSKGRMVTLVPNDQLALAEL